MYFFFFSSRRRHTRWPRDWSSDVCSSDLREGDHAQYAERAPGPGLATRRLQRAHGPLRGPRPSVGAARPDGGRPRRDRGPVLLPCVAGGLAGRVGRRRPDTRPVPGRRHPPSLRDRRARAPGRAGPPHRTSQPRGRGMIRLESVSKRYGRFTAVHPLDLHVRPGELFGFLGPNGAGKTTTIRMLVGVLRPTAGRVVVTGHDMETDPIAAKSRIGYIPDRPFVYD